MLSSFSRLLVQRGVSVATRVSTGSFVNSSTGLDLRLGSYGDPSKTPRYKTYLLLSHIGGAYDTVPELCILLSLFGASDRYYPIVFDEAGS
jgi:hypothetical protein